MRVLSHIRRIKTFEDQMKELVDFDKNEFNQNRELSCIQRGVLMLKNLEALAFKECLPIAFDYERSAQEMRNLIWATGGDETTMAAVMPYTDQIIKEFEEIRDEIFAAGSGFGAH